MFCGKSCSATHPSVVKKKVHSMNQKRDAIVEKRLRTISNRTAEERSAIGNRVKSTILDRYGKDGYWTPARLAQR